MSSIYFGGSRHLKETPGNLSIINAVVSSVIASGQPVHVGCQFGADALVIRCAGLWQARTILSSLVVFAVAPNLAEAPTHVQWADTTRACIVYSAGGNSAPMPARYLLRSIRAMRECSAAVFFSPGPGSLACAREATRAGLPVYAFQQEAPAPVPSVSGQWAWSSFHGFPCWQWSAPTQPELF